MAGGMIWAADVRLTPDPIARDAYARFAGWYLGLTVVSAVGALWILALGLARRRTKR